MHDESKEGIEVDQRLVLAAPDLLAACQAVKVWWQEGKGISGGWYKIMEQIDNAIAKATR